MRFKQPNCKRLQGAADARRRARRRTFVLQVPDNKADAVPCERLHVFYVGGEDDHQFTVFIRLFDSAKKVFGERQAVEPWQTFLVEILYLTDQPGQNH
jgi:hypothetical protein